MKEIQADITRLFEINPARPRQVSRFKAPVRIEQEEDRFGCVGFTSYGFIQAADGEIKHIKNPDFDWSPYGK